MKLKSSYLSLFVFTAAISALAIDPEDGITQILLIRRPGLY